MGPYQKMGRDFLLKEAEIALWFICHTTFFVFITKEKDSSAVRSRILSKLIFASRVLYFDCACCGVYDLVKYTGGRLPCMMAPGPAGRIYQNGHPIIILRLFLAHRTSYPGPYAFCCVSPFNPSAPYPSIVSHITDRCCCVSSFVVTLIGFVAFRLLVETLARFWCVSPFVVTTSVLCYVSLLFYRFSSSAFGSYGVSRRIF